MVSGVDVVLYVATLTPYVVVLRCVDNHTRHAMNRQLLNETRHTVRTLAITIATAVAILYLPLTTVNILWEFLRGMKNFHYFPKILQPGIRTLKRPAPNRS